ncbi:MAG: hypothetical protein HOJ35_13125 [Bdellovibrionales bacterium]|nr:hypothetical protein [Bdellovibrionales bacterium]
MTEEKTQITKYNFVPLGAQNDNSTDENTKWEFKKFKLLSDIPKDQLNKESEIAESSGFLIEKSVTDLRGISEVRRENKENEIESKVAEKIKEIEKNAFEKGYQDGVEKATEAINEKLNTEVEKKISKLEGLITELQSNYSKTIENQKKEIYQMINSLTKWVILRELSDDGNYLNRLLEKLILELGTKSNILIQVNKSDFEKMGDVLEKVESSVGKLHNARVEIDYDNNTHGMILESDNGIIQGTLDDQFVGIDKLFSTVVGHE